MNAQVAETFVRFLKEGLEKFIIRHPFVGGLRLSFYALALDFTIFSLFESGLYIVLCRSSYVEGRILSLRLVGG